LKTNFFVTYGMKVPPLTQIVCPVMYDASGDARNSTAAATSSTDPNRPIGMAAKRRNLGKTFG